MARCSHDSDKLRIPRIMGIRPGGLHEFNRYIPILTKKLEAATGVPGLEPYSVQPGRMQELLKLASAQHHPLQHCDHADRNPPAHRLQLITWQVAVEEA